MKAWVGLLILFASQLQNAEAAAPVTSICETQVRNFVEADFGLRVKAITWDFNPWNDAKGGWAWVVVDGCSGRILVTLNGLADRYTCFRQSFFGPVPNVIANAVATGDCEVSHVEVDASASSN